MFHQATDDQSMAFFVGHTDCQKLLSKIPFRPAFQKRGPEFTFQRALGEDKVKL